MTSFRFVRDFQCTNSAEDSMKARGNVDMSGKKGVWGFGDVGDGATGAPSSALPCSIPKTGWNWTLGVAKDGRHTVSGCLSELESLFRPLIGPTSFLRFSSPCMCGWCRYCLLHFSLRLMSCRESSILNSFLSLAPTYLDPSP